MLEHQPLPLDQPEQSPQKPKTMEEHRAEFTKQYQHVLVDEATWVEEDGRAVEGRVYNYSVLPTWKESLKVGEFRLKARQAGFQIVDRIEIPNVYQGSRSTNITLHQFHLEGRPLAVPSPQGQSLSASPTNK